MNTRASEALYDEMCAGRFLAQSVVDVVEEDTEDAVFGRSIHAALAKGDPSKLTHNQLDIYESCIEIVTIAAEQYFGTDAPAAINNAIREHEFKVQIDGHDHIGHPDIIYRIGTRAMVPDFKTLPGEHDSSDENRQLRDYVAMVYASNEFPLLDEIATAIIQPLVTRNPTICVYKHDDIMKATQKMAERVTRSWDPNSPRTPGDRQCQYCRAKLVCREYNAWAGDKLPVPRTLVDVPVADWTPTQRAVFLNNRKAAQKWLDDTEAEIKRLLEKQPDAVPGWRLKDGNEVDTLVDLQTIFERFVAMGGKLEKFMECLKGVKIKGKLEEQLRAITGAKGKGLDALMDQLLSGAVEKKRNAPSLERIK